MKIEIEIKNAPKHTRMDKMAVDQTLHKGLDLRTLISAIKKTRPWGKIIDIRIDLR